MSDLKQMREACVEAERRWPNERAEIPYATFLALIACAEALEQLLDWTTSNAEGGGNRFMNDTARAALAQLEAAP